MIERYHNQLSQRLGDAFDERTWEPQLRLALLGQLVRLIGFMLWAAYDQTADPLLSHHMLEKIAMVDRTSPPRVGLDLTMQHECFESLESMLSIEAMSTLEGRAVTSVEGKPWTPPQYHAYSGCQLLKVRTSAQDESRHYVVKRTSYATGIIRRLTEDDQCRERLIWQRGLLDRLPTDITSPMLACAKDDDGWSLLMLEVEQPLQRLERWRADGLYQLNLAEISTFVSALATMHAHFYADPQVCDPALGLCTSRQLFTWNSPTNLERHAQLPHWFVNAHGAGWDLLDRLDAPDVAAGLRAVHADPTPLLDALAIFPKTLIHGDPRRENVGIVTDTPSRLVLIDWQFVSAQPPAVDLAWLLNFYGPSAVPRDVVIELYRQQLALRLGDRFDQASWEPQLRLALLGQALRILSGMLNAAYNSDDAAVRAAWLGHLPWWTEQGATRLEVSVTEMQILFNTLEAMLSRIGHLQCSDLFQEK